MNNELLTSLCVIAICISIGAIVYTSMTRVSTDDWELRVKDLRDHSDYLADELTKCQDLCKALKKHCESMQTDIHHIDVNQVKTASKVEELDKAIATRLKPIAKSKTNK